MSLLKQRVKAKPLPFYLKKRQSKSPKRQAKVELSASQKPFRKKPTPHTKSRATQKMSVMSHKKAQQKEKNPQILHSVVRSPCFVKPKYPNSTQTPLKTRFEIFAILYIRRKISQAPFCHALKFSTALNPAFEKIKAHIECSRFSQVPFCQVAKFHPLEKSPFENFCVPFFKPQIFARPNSSQITIFQHLKSPFSRHIFAQNSLKILQIQP